MYGDGGRTMAVNVQDRTGEFAAAVQTLRSRKGMIAPVRRETQSNTHKHSDFIKIAKSISKDICDTYDKLQKLTLLASKKSLYDDNPAEIQDLTYMIKKDVNALHRNIGQLHEFVNSRSSNPRGHQTKNSKNVVSYLQTRLANISTKFKSVLEMRTENLKKANQRRGEYTNSQGQSNGALATTLMQDEDAQNSSVIIDIPFGATQQELAQMERQNTYIEDRADAMRSIESTIVELGGIFQQLGRMIAEQGQMVERIDSNVADTEMNVDAAQTELMKYWQSVSSNRWLMLKIFGILIVFFVIFVVVLA